MAMCDKNSRFLFEVAPHIIPQGYPTDLEQELWALHFADKEKRMKVDHPELFKGR